MNYLYECGNEIISVYRNSNEFSNKVYVTSDKNKTFDEQECLIQNDKQGKFFIWNNNKIYLDNFKKISIQSIKDKLAKDEWITESELLQAILTEGVENVHFEIPMMKVDGRFMGLCVGDPNKNIATVCHIEEEFNRMVSDAYKVKLVPDNYDGTTPKREDYYTSDLVSALRSGYIKIV